MAVILPVFLVLLAVPLFLAVVFWCYSAGQKAAHDAARYLSTATQAEMRTYGGGFGESTVAATARWIAQQELEGILPFTDGIPITVECNASTCGAAAVPATVHVQVRIGLHDTFFDSITTDAIGDTGMEVASDVTLRYVGG
jgi:cbb3-type cytochrome oxidase subunit 3